MYRLMKSEQHILNPMHGEAMCSYSQIQLEQFPLLSAALAACQAANDKADVRHYVLDQAGKEYYQGIWIN